MWDERKLIVCEAQIQERLKERTDEKHVKFNYSADQIEDVIHPDQCNSYTVP